MYLLVCNISPIGDFIFIALVDSEVQTNNLSLKTYKNEEELGFVLIYYFINSEWVGGHVLVNIIILLSIRFKLINEVLLGDLWLNSFS